MEVGAQVDKISVETTRLVFRYNEQLDLNGCFKFVQSAKCGAINLFVGTIRDSDLAQQHNRTTDNEARDEGGHSRQSPTVTRPIDAIYYEAYESMARAQILEIIEQSRQKISTTYEPGKGRRSNDIRVCVEIRLGRVPVGEAAIMICVSSERRASSHRMTMTILEEVKAQAAIWKKVIFSDGTEQWDCPCKSEASWLVEKYNK